MFLEHERITPSYFKHYKKTEEKKNEKRNQNNRNSSISIRISWLLIHIYRFHIFNNIR